MTFTDLLEILVCVFAVYGVYALLCHLLAFLCPKTELSIGVHLDRKGGGRAAEEFRYAVILTEEHRGHFRPPVFLLDEEADPAVLAALHAQGCDIYRKTDP